MLVAVHGNYYRALASAHIAFKMKDLLPCSEQRFTIGDRQRQRWPEQRRLQMRVPVPVVPCLFMPVFAAGGMSLSRSEERKRQNVWLPYWNETFRQPSPIG